MLICGTQAKNVEFQLAGSCYYSYGFNAICYCFIFFCGSENVTGKLIISHHILTLLTVMDFFIDLFEILQYIAREVKDTEIEIFYLRK
jgi:hypothetical protein